MAGTQIKYVGPLDSYIYEGMNFIRKKPVTVPDAIAVVALSHPTVFLPAEAEIPEEVEALREKLGHALIAEGQDRAKAYRRVLARAEDMGESTKAERERRDATIAGAEEQIEHGEAHIQRGRDWLKKVAKEQADAAKTSKTKTPEA